MKKLFTLLIALFTLLTLVACNTKKDNDIHFGVSFYPAPQIAELIKDDLSALGYNLVIREFTSYAAANPALKTKEIDANFIQHQYYLANYNKEDDANIVVAKRMYHSKFSLFSSVYESLSDIPNNSEIIIPNDNVNTARALLLLQTHGLITLAEGKTYDATVNDIVVNEKHLTFKLSGLTASQDDFEEQGRELAIMYPTYTTRLTNFDREGSILVSENFEDELTQSYAITVAVRSQDLETPKIKALLDARNWLIENYGWAAIPAF